MFIAAVLIIRSSQLRQERNVPGDEIGGGRCRPSGAGLKVGRRFYKYFVPLGLGTVAALNI